MLTNTLYTIIVPYYSTMIQYYSTILIQSGLATLCTLLGTLLYLPLARVSRCSLMILVRHQNNLIHESPLHSTITQT
jgi:hypothetical protein